MYRVTIIHISNIFLGMFENMNKLTGFVILLFTVLVLSVCSATYVTKAFAIYFGNGACPSGEARDYIGICFPVKECKASLFAAAGTCKVSEPQCTKVNGENRCTVTTPKYEGSPIPAQQTKKFVNSIPICNFHHRDCTTWLGQRQSITSWY